MEFSGGVHRFIIDEGCLIPASWQAGGMEIEMTDQARKVLEKKGGVMSIDFIRPTG